MAKGKPNPDKTLYRGWRDERFATVPTNERGQLYSRLVWERDQGLCGICGNPVRLGLTMQVDHIVPVSDGGLDEPANVRASHARCNMTRNCERPKAPHRTVGRSSWVVPAKGTVANPERPDRGNTLPLRLWVDVPVEMRSERTQIRARYLRDVPLCLAAVPDNGPLLKQCSRSVPSGGLCTVHLRKVAYDAETLI